MANQWLRLWHDMPTDPKWRTISRISQKPITAVLAVYVHMLVCASNATERGRTQSWSDEDVASALDLETEFVAAIRQAMQGRVLDEDYLTGWDSRQPKREDGSSERSKAWRDQQKRAAQDSERNRTQPNATERPDKDADTEKKGVKGTRFAMPDPPVEWIQFCQTHRPDLDPGTVFDGFRDYWIARPGREGVKLDWFATWRNWVRNQKSNIGGKHGQSPKSKLDIAAEGIARAAAKRERGGAGPAGSHADGLFRDPETLWP